ncbi:MAG: hypothetical protein EOO26_11885 [Comamonadaceae bacterium]|nr:MAG: hypothetical protein EOO26_11885 [Comamonadaceae bacterium]
MSDTAKPFAFSQFVPGFDFLKNLATGGGTGSGSALPGLSNWVAPTLSVEEVDKRIQELKTVQYWLEQNGHALKATIQALEVQKMTLSTLRGMNVRMEDIANAFTRAATPAAEPPAAASPSFFKSSAPAAAPLPEPEVEDEEEEEEENEDDDPVTEAAPEAAAPAASGASGGVVDPLQWWGSLTQQFQQIASSALQDAAQLKMPSVAQPLADAVGSVIGTKKPAARTPARKAAPARKTAAKKRPAARKAPAKKSSGGAAAARKR